MRPFASALLHSLVKARDGQPAGGGIAADFVERQKAMKAIERGILERLRHHRTGELLHLEGEAAVARNAMAGAPLGDKVERQRIAQEKIGRASCREKGENTVGGGTLKKRNKGQTERVLGADDK